MRTERLEGISATAFATTWLATAFRRSMVFVFGFFLDRLDQTSYCPGGFQSKIRLYKRNWQIGKFIGSYGYTAKGHQYQTAGGRPVFCFV